MNTIVKGSNDRSSLSAVPSGEQPRARQVGKQAGSEYRRRHRQRESSGMAVEAIADVLALMVWARKEHGIFGVDVDLEQMREHPRLTRLRS